MKNKNIYGLVSILCIISIIFIVILNFYVYDSIKGKVVDIESSIPTATIEYNFEGKNYELEILNIPSQEIGEYVDVIWKNDGMYYNSQILLTEGFINGIICILGVVGLICGGKYISLKRRKNES